MLVDFCMGIPADTVGLTIATVSQDLIWICTGRHSGMNYQACQGDDSKGFNFLEHFAQY